MSRLPLRHSESLADDLAAFDLAETQVCLHLATQTARRLGAVYGLLHLAAAREAHRRAHDAALPLRLRLARANGRRLRVHGLPYA